MDILRGIAIFLVLLNHAWMIAEATNTAPPLLTTVNNIFAPLRMPLLVVLSGFLVEHSLAKGRHRYIVGKLRAVLHPYIVFTILTTPLQVAMDTAAGESSIQAILAPLYGGAYLWYLLYIFVFYLIAMVVPYKVTWLALIALWLPAFFAPVEWHRFLILGGFFMAGRYLGPSLPMIAAFSVTILGVISAIPGWIMLFWLAVSGVAVRYEPFAIPIVGSAIIGAIALAQCTSRLGPRRLRWLLFVGQNSLIFYVVHYYPTVIAGRVISAITTNGWLIAAGAFIAGLTVSVCIAVLAQRSKLIHALFTFPTRGTTSRA